MKACLLIQFASTGLFLSSYRFRVEAVEAALPNTSLVNKYYFEAALPKRFIRYLCIDYEAAMPYPMYCRMCTEFHYLLIICLYSGKQDALTNMVP